MNMDEQTSISSEQEEHENKVKELDKQYDSIVKSMVTKAKALLEKLDEREKIIDKEKEFIKNKRKEIYANLKGVDQDAGSVTEGGEPVKRRRRRKTQNDQ